ncbi:MAG TPA: SDR family oxidoreductase [Caulobacteraceae bacterium]|nr:SDR family oxidoreductase [Caulobacteraceae bacterium]
MSARLALVTGASAGIGAAFARLYASHGYDLAITARREARLKELADEIRMRHGVEVLVLPADLADPKTPDALLAEIEGHGRGVDALVNNAGYGVPGPYASVGWAEHAAFLQVMLVSVCELTHKVLPGMIDRRFGRVVNVASLAGLVPGSPGATLYGASKAFLVRFSQSLHLELQATGVHVSALCPGFTYSEFHDANQTRAQVTEATPQWLWMGADEVAAAGYEAAEANRPMCVTGAPNKAIAALGKLIPDEWAMALMATQAGRIRGR